MPTDAERYRRPIELRLTFTQALALRHVVAAKPAPDFAGRNRATRLGIPNHQVNPSDTMTARGNSGSAARHYRKD